MKEEKEVKLSFWASHVTTIVSVTLLLLIGGVIALVSIGAQRETRRLKEKMEVSLVLSDSVPDTRANAICAQLAQQPYVMSPKVVTKEEALQTWKKDTGEDLNELFGVNPLSPEISFSIKSDYSTPSNLKNIYTSLKKLQDVEEVVMPDASLVDAMNNNIRNLAIGLGSVAVVLIFISFVLINNTVHLTVYSRRFTIHTMQLVGATNGFIRRPVILGNMSAGMIAGLFASVLLGAALWIVPQTSGMTLESFIPWGSFGIVAAALVICGALLCALASFISTTRYLHKDYNELFK